MKYDLKLTECPRDAMQGWEDFIPTETKVRYLQALLAVGFDTLDFGSFVSPKAIPQLRDTAEVLAGLDLRASRTSLLAIVANARGAEEACRHEPIRFLGFPFSVSEEFQRRNTNASIAESLERVREIRSLASAAGKEVLIYISMGFGNPYGEAWNPDLVVHWVQRLAEDGIRRIALADTVGVSNPENIRALFSQLIPAVPEVTFGAHLHSHPSTWEEKIDAAYESGCRHFDLALKGIGGCPMANNDLVGNIATENVVMKYGGPEALGLDPAAWMQSCAIAAEIFHG
jgi:hydroxymethylglutaryl-CoA lyase